MALRMIPPKGKDSVPVFNAASQSMRVYLDHPVDEEEGTVVPQAFKKAALTLGCIFVGDVYDDDDDQDLAPTIDQQLVAGIGAILERDDSEEVDADGKPKLAALKTQVGFNVTKAQFSSAWTAFEATLV